MDISITPAPGTYKPLGEFDFRSGDSPGKKLKFYYGIKPTIRQFDRDLPGPGTYEV
jgi:hypothetical protein